MAYNCLMHTVTRVYMVCELIPLVRLVIVPHLLFVVLTDVR